jgi:hypothetical protein
MPGLPVLPGGGAGGVGRRPTERAWIARNVTLGEAAISPFAAAIAADQCFAEGRQVSSKLSATDPARFLVEFSLELGAG